MTSFVLQIKDPRWADAPDSSDWQAVAARMLAAVMHVARESLTAETRKALSGEICLVLTDDAEIGALNKAWRGKDGPTNVLSFPAEDDLSDEPQNTETVEEAILGDVVFAFETIAREAIEQDKSFHNHMVHLLVHGVLHLLGYDHQSDKEAGQMEDLERKILATLDIADPYEASCDSDSAARSQG